MVDLKTFGRVLPFKKFATTLATVGDLKNAKPVGISKTPGQPAIDKDYYRLSCENNEPQTGDFKVRELELRFNNLCNLKCRMCSPKFSSKWEHEINSNPALKAWIEKDEETDPIYNTNRLMSNEDVREMNQKILEDLDDEIFDLQKVLFTGGEVLMQKEHYIALEKLLPKAKDIHLSYTTNLNYLSFERYSVLDLWKQFKAVTIRISIDSDPEFYSYIRSGGSIETVEKNINLIRQTLSPKQFHLVGTCTTSIYNISRLPKILKYFTRLQVYVHTSLVEYPSFLSPQVLPMELKLAVKKEIDQFLSNMKITDLPVDDLNFIKPERQLFELNKWMRNSERFMMGADRSKLWRNFLEFNSFIDKDNQELFQFYPEWRDYQ
ncbi:MAG: radical SAM protein [Bdellovibrionales bacterium]|nr:radical SAM protein [Bdellovibrionales bacterium]